MNSVTLAAILSSGLDADVRAYAAAIAANGGSVSQQWLRSVNTFVQGCKTDGTWDSLLDVGLLCGVNDLNAALVKLKAPTGVSRILTNNNFVSADYTPSGSTAGLLGNGTTKSLINASNISLIASITSVHIGVYNTSACSAGNRNAIGSYFGPSQCAFLRTTQFVDSSDFSLGSIGGGNNGTRIGSTIASIVGTSLGGYSNGVQINSRVASGALPNEQTRIFGVEETGFTATYDGTLSAYHIGTGLTDAQVSALSNRVNALMASIGANKY